MNSYTSIRDVARLLWQQKRDHIEAYRAGAAKGDRLASAHMAMDALHVAQLDGLVAAGRVLSAVAEAHERDPAALAAVIGRPLEAP